MMKSGILYLLILFGLIATCEQKKTGFDIRPVPAEHPFKFLIGGTKDDSTKIIMFAPQKLELKNNYSHKVKLSQAYISLNGGNIMAPNPLYYMDNGLVRYPGKLYESGESDTYIFYAGYIFVVHQSFVDSLKNKSRFAQMESGSAVYDMKIENYGSSYLKTKVPDSLKGFMNFDFYNFDTRLRFVESIPIEF